MAKQKSAGSSTFKSQGTFDKSLVTDTSDFHLPENSWTYARNAINNTRKGDLGKLSTEPANNFCTFAPYTIIGALHIEEDRWLMFSTNNTDSEIGIFKEGSCSYSTIVNDKCLNFNTDNLIKGITRATFDCSFNAYWDDGRNVSRVLDIGAVPWIQVCTTVNGCTTCVDTTDLDCDKIRLESFIETPCVNIVKGKGVASILNGSYQAQVAYLVDDQRVTDYFIPSNALSLFNHTNVNSSIDIYVSNLDLSFDNYELVLISTINEKTVARKIGIYSTRQNVVSIDYIDITLPVVPLADLTVITPIPDKSEAIFNVGQYALRVGPTTKFDFNYQPLANQIGTFWQTVEYKNEYYKNGGTNIGYMRDEVYSFFIRWVYNTGDKSNSYHIPGRGPGQFFLTNDAGGNAGAISEVALCPTTINDIETPDYTPRVFEVYNTASLISTPNTTLPDGGLLVAEGQMGYWESVELYDDKHPEIWNSFVPGRPDWDLCGQPIRHHKFPENVITSGGATNTITNHYKDGGDKIRIMGVRFDNIQPPKDNNGNIITNIVGYEILRGNRTGTKSVLYKGLINNMFEYDAPNLITNRKALYANYPFNDLRPDPFISSNTLPTSYEPLQGGLINYTPNADYSKKHFTFHSPDTMFARPFLVDDEVKIYGAAWGDSQGSYVEPKNHPRHKFITDISFYTGIVVGFGYAITKVLGAREVKYRGYQVDSDPIFGGSSTSAGNIIPAGFAVDAAQINAINVMGIYGMTDAMTGQNSGAISATGFSQGTLITTSKTAAAVPSSGVTSGFIEVTYKDQDAAPGILRAALALMGNPMFISYMAAGADITYKLIESLGAWQQFTLQYQSLCKYEKFAAPYANNRRRRVNDARYLNSGVQDYSTNYIVNHIYRNETVMFDTPVNIENITGTIVDVSRPPRVSAMPINRHLDNFSRRASSHYVALKTRLRNQYGQLQSIRQLLVSSCVTPIASTNSPTLFGGDTYIGKYSEKNTLFYFQQWLDGQPDGAILNYNKQKMFEWTAFWMDTDPFDLMEFFQSFPQALTDAINAGSISTFFSSIVTPSDKHCFDRLPGGNNGVFLLKRAFMYLFNSGVRDFFVESEFNIDMRDWQDTDAKKHYPVLSDLRTIFNMNLIKADNYYQIDRSLSWSFMASQKIPWGVMQARDYNPLLSETCYTKYPRRMLYSLPQTAGAQNISLAKKDQWRVFLPNNYVDYESNVTSVKSINRTAALILFENQAPGMLPGVDEMQTQSGANIVIGDGRLFSRQLQQLSNSENSYEYASCQSRLSVLNTPAGVFWMNLNQGKIFCYAGGLKEISLKGNRFWLNTYLPYKLLEDFPTYSVTDNPVAGIGCQTIYDNEYSLVYFCKKDYKLKKNLPVTVEYMGGSKFLINSVFIAKTGDPLYFDDCSWTLSYDPKIEEFVSFHDWHPDLSLGAKNTFLSTKDNSIWKHNNICSLYCNYYGKDYPFEVEFQLDNKFAVATMRNVEYYIESYVYDEQNCYDRFHVLDHGFDEAVVYNSEQVSGLLKLHLTPKNNLPLLLTFPNIQTNYISILFSKEEQQYRFNQFWDVTNDRGEYSGAEERIWMTEDNGYIRNLNPVNLNYDKQEFQRKKFRHFNNRVILRRTKNNNVEILVSLAASNQQLSHR